MPDCRRRPGTVAPAAFAAAVLLFAGCTRTPALDEGALVDRSATLDAEARSRIETYLRFVRSEYGVDYRVVLAPRGDLGEPASEAERWFRQLDVGRGAGDRGLLLWIDPARRLARIEVGYALEPLVPDLSASWMIDGYLAPRFLDAELPASIEASIEALVDRIRPRLAELGTNGVAIAGSGGAGAGQDLAPVLPPESTPSDDLSSESRDDPRSVRESELAMLRAGRYDATAPIYDPDWRRAHASGRPGSWSPERLREIARQWERPYEIESDGEHAVAYAVDSPELGPTLLRREPDGWVIDATAGARLVIYDYSNRSWYLLDERSPYLDLLREVVAFERVSLASGRAAWRPAARPER